MARTVTPREKRERVVVYLGPNTVAKLKTLAAIRDDNLSGVVRFIVAEWLNRSRGPAGSSAPALLNAGAAISLDQEIGREAHRPGDGDLR